MLLGGEVVEALTDEVGRVDRLQGHHLAAEAAEAEQVVDQPAHLAAAVADPLEQAARLVGQGGGVLVHQDLGEAVDGPQGGAEVVRDRVGEALQLLVGGLELGGAILNAPLQLLVEESNLLLGPLPLGDVGDLADEVQRETGRVAHQRDAQDDPHGAAVLMEIPLLRLVRWDLPPEEAPHLGDLGLEVVRVGDVLEGHPQQLVLGIPDHPAAGQKRDRSDIAKSGDFSACPYCQ